MNIDSLKNKFSLSLLPLIAFVQTPILWIRILCGIYIANVFLFDNVFGFWLEKHFGNFKLNKKYFIIFYSRITIRCIRNSSTLFFPLIKN